jgi:hypothetical protein
VGGRLFKRARKKENVKEEEVRRGMEWKTGKTGSLKSKYEHYLGGGNQKPFVLKGSNEE